MSHRHKNLVKTNGASRTVLNFIFETQWTCKLHLLSFLNQSEDYGKALFEEIIYFSRMVSPTHVEAFAGAETRVR